MVILKDLWPDEPPPEQLAIWAAMSATEQDEAAKRLRAVVAYEAGGSRKAADYVAEPGISVPRFHSMLRAWRQDRSLLSLLPQARRRAARAFEVPPGIEAAAAEAVRAEDAGSQETIAIALHERFGHPSLSWIRRLVAKARREHEREMAGGDAGFGRRIVIDSAALPLPLLAQDDGNGRGDASEVDVEWAVAAFAWDAATGHVCGHVLERAPAGIALHVAAGAASAKTLRDMDRRGSATTTPVIVTTLPLDDRDTVETLRLIGKLTSAGGEVIHSPRAAGSQLMKAFGGRIGSIELRPRYASDTFVGRVSREDALSRSGRVPMTLDEARLVLAHDVAAWNAGIGLGTGSFAVSPDVVADRIDEFFAAVGGS